MANKHIINNLLPLTQYDILLSGVRVATRMSSSSGTVSFSGTATTGYTLQPTTDKTFSMVGGLKSVAMMSPSPGETFIAGGAMRLVASGLDLAEMGTGHNDGMRAQKVEWFLNDTKVATELFATRPEFNVFKARISNVAAGTYVAWARATYLDGTILDSYPFPITVVAAPTYGSTITLTGDLDITGLAHRITGTPGSRVRVNGNGHKIIGTPTSIAWAYVDFYNLGGLSYTGVSGVDVTTGGALSLVGNRWFECSTQTYTQTGTGTTTCTGNTLSSNSVIPAGQYPNVAVSDVNYDSYPAMQFLGNASGAKTFKANNIAAGWVELYSPNWTYGGTVEADTNVCMGVRIGMYTGVNFTAAAPLERNFLYHIYYGGWSQASIWYMDDITMTAQHNVLIGSSWPVRHWAGSFQYNLVIGCDREEGLVWTRISPADVHHNVCWHRQPTRESFYQIYGAASTVRNNTVDYVGATVGVGPAYLNSGSMDLNSNLFMSPISPVQIDGGALTADYNDFFAAAGAHYSDGRTPAHDTTTNPQVVNRQLTPISFIPADVWKRTKSVAAILSDWRVFYTPTAALDTGDTATYGAGNDKGAVGAGAANASDRFGTIV